MVGLIAYVGIALADARHARAILRSGTADLGRAAEALQVFQSQYPQARFYADDTARVFLGYFSSEKLSPNLHSFGEQVD